MKKLSFLLSFVFLWTVFFLSGTAIAQQSNVIVPNVEGIAQGIAAQILRTAGLQPRVQQSANSETIVVRQDPRPGYLLPIGSEVLLVTDTMAPTTQVIPTSKRIAIQASSSETLPAPIFQRTTGTNVSVIPVIPGQQTAQPEQYGVMQDSRNFIIARHPQQVPANRYLLAETNPKRYPVWYPRAYLESQGQPITVTTAQRQTASFAPQVQSLAQSSVSPYLVQIQAVPRQRASEWYAVPQGWATSQAWTTKQTWETQQVWTNQQTWPGQQGYTTTYSAQPGYIQNQLMTTGAVPVPNVMRLSQTNAMFAIQKAGLVVGNLNVMQNAQIGAGLVINQSPRPRSIVQSGTRVDLWIAN